MQKKTHTMRNDLHFMPWQIAASEGLKQPCILVATMRGNEIQTISLHVSGPPPQDTATR